MPTASAHGQTLVYEDEGSGALVVLFHGFPDTPASWAGIAARLVEGGYRVVTPWLRGYHPDTIVEGRPYDAATIGEDALRLLDALGEQSAVVVGHDWGASIAYAAASLAPDRVPAIVPIAVPHPGVVRPSPRLAWAVRHFAALRVPWAERSTERGDFAYVDRLYHRWSPRWTGPARDESVRRVKECFRDRRCLTGAIDYYRAISLRQPKAIADPPKVRGLVAGGTHDVFPADLLQTTADALGPGSEALVLDGAGHWAHRERESEFTDALLRFLGSPS